MLPKDFASVPVVWEPNQTIAVKIKERWRNIGKKYNRQIESYWDLHEWSVEKNEEFWGEVWNLSEVIHSESYKSIVSIKDGKQHSPEWFPGARLNYAENLMRYRDDKIALIATGEERETKNYTYGDVYTEVRQYAAALKNLGVKKGDRVACYMSNREEAIFAMLGTSSVGAIWTGALPLVRAKAVLDRFQRTNPKVLFTIDRFLYSNCNYDMLSEVKEISNELTSLEKVIIVPSKKDSLTKNISEIRNSCFLEEFLSLGAKMDGSYPDVEFEQLPFDYPVSICYTSGSTGLPKVLVHGIGILMSSSREFYIQGLGLRNKVLLNTSPVGWASWNIYITRLAFGATVVVYEGEPFLKHPTCCYDLIDQFSITDIFVTPGILDDMEKLGYLPSSKNHLKSLRVVLSGASVVKPQNFDFIYKKVKTDVLFASLYGFTEMMGGCAILDATLPIYKGEISAPSLGTDVHCYDEAGNSICGEVGEIVIAAPTPAMPLGMWEDPTGEQYKKLYFEKYPGVFSIGDMGYINPVTKGLVICGRSDDSMNSKGTRFGSSEIYNVVDTFPEVMDSVCVSQYNKNNDERVVLFLRMRNDHLFTEDLVRRIRQAIKRELTDDYEPDVVLETPGIPHNATGKKMESIVKKLINNRPCNPETVVNFECLDFYVNIPDLQNY